MGETVERSVVLPADRTLGIEENIVRTLVNRHMRQIVYVRLGKILLFLRATVTEDLHFLRVDACSAQFIETHAAHTAFAHAYLHPMTIVQHRGVDIRMDACDHRQA